MFRPHSFCSTPPLFVTRSRQQPLSQSIFVCLAGVLSLPLAGAKVDSCSSVTHAGQTCSSTVSIDGDKKLETCTSPNDPTKRLIRLASRYFGATRFSDREESRGILEAELAKLIREKLAASSSNNSAPNFKVRPIVLSCTKEMAYLFSLLNEADRSMGLSSRAKSLAKLRAKQAAQIKKRSGLDWLTRPFRKFRQPSRGDGIFQYGFSRRNIVRGFFEAVLEPAALGIKKQPQTISHQPKKICQAVRPDIVGESEVKS